MKSRMYKPAAEHAPGNGNALKYDVGKFGSGCPVCPHCSAKNPFSLHTTAANGRITAHDPPTHCHACDGALAVNSAE